MVAAILMSLELELNLGLITRKKAPNKMIVRKRMLISQNRFIN